MISEGSTAFENEFFVENDFSKKAQI